MDKEALNTFKGVDGKDIPYFASWKEKKAKDFQLAKDMVDYYDILHGNPSSERMDWIDENYDLYNGRWPDIENMNVDLNFSAGSENVSLQGAKLRHYPYIDSIARSIVAEVGLRPITPIVIDTSSDSTNERKRFKMRKVGDYLQNNALEPIRQRVTQQYKQEMGIDDPYSLDAKQQKQMQADLQKRVKQETPQDLVDFLDSHRLPTEKMGQIFINYLMKEADMKQKFVNGFRDGVIAGEEYHLVRILNGKPFHESLNPKNVLYGGSEDTRFVEDGEWAKYEQYSRFSRILQRYGGSLDKKDVEKLQEMYQPMLGVSDNKKTDSSSIDRQILKDVANGKIDQTGIDYKTREGQQKIAELYRSYGSSGREAFGIKESYVTWKWNRKIKEVKRIVDGEIEKFYFDESYDISELKGDVEARELYVPQTWHGVKLGELSDIYVNVEPVPYQYNNLDNPFETKLTIFGGKYNRLRGNSKNLGLIDRAKPWQYRYNVQMRRIEEYESTNVGKVLLGTANMKPHDWTWQQFFTSMRYGKFVPTNTHGEHVNSVDAQFFKSIDLSNIMDISHALEQLQFTERKMANAMYYNPSKLGSVSPYMTSSNNQKNIQAADKQLYEYYRTHGNIRDRVLQAMMNTARIAYKEGGLTTSVLMDDMTRAGLEVDEYDMSFESLALHVKDDYKEFQKMEVVKKTINEFIMNGYGDIEDFIKVLDADSMGEVKRIASNVSRKRRDQQRQQQKAQAQMSQKEKQMEQQMMKLKNQMDMMKMQKEQEFRLKQSEIEAEKYANQFDIDKNKVNDQLQIKRAELEAERAISESELQMEKYKADQRAQLEREKLEKMDK